MYVTGPEGLATSVDDGETWSIEALAPVRDENGEVFSTGSRVPGHAYCRGMIIKPDDPDTMFIGIGNTVPGEIGGIQRTRDGGATWEYVALPVVPNSLVYWLGTHAETPDVIAAASIFGYVYLSEDGGKTWMKPRRDVLPAFGNREVADIKLRDMAPALNKLSHVLRQRTRSVLRDTFKLAMADGELSVNPAGETMDALLCKSSHKPIHYAAVSWQDIPGLYGMLDDDMAALCIRFGILAAARPSETREAKWNEIDLEQSVWEVPAARMKKGRAHRVPLSDEAVAVLALARKHGGDGPYLFPAPTKHNAPISTRPVERCLKALTDTTLHGFRSAFRSWAADTNKPFDVAETALAHAVGSQVERSYQRSDLLEARRTLMEEWADYLTARGEQA